MNTEDNIRHRARCLITSLILLMLVPVCNREVDTDSSGSRNPFHGKNLTCAIYLSNELTSKQGLETGYNYALLKKFAEDNHCYVEILVKEDEHYADSLETGGIDIYITRKGEIQKTDSISVSDLTDGLYVWGISDDAARKKVKCLNKWLRHISQSKESTELRERFRGSFNPFRLAEKEVTRDRVSPYDMILKEKAKELNWDWRMLAAIVYQESRFSIKSESHKGAKGLMQLMPAVAEKYELKDPVDPEQNIAAGVKVLAKIKSSWDNSGLSETELINFTLASYNAGDGRIKDCWNLAKAKGYDVTKWDEVKKVIPLMRDDSILQEESVKLGKFHGHETIRYVNTVTDLYEAICKIHPEK